MKIALTHLDLPNESKGGVAYQVHYMANNLAHRGHDVTMYTFSPAYAECRYKVHTLPRPRLPRQLMSIGFAARIGQIDFAPYDVLHTNGDNYLVKRGYPQVRTYYGSAADEARSATRLRRRLAQVGFAWLETVSQRSASINVGISRITQERLPGVSQIVPCGVDTERFYAGPKSTAPSILFVGTAGGRKRGSLLAEVFCRDVLARVPDAKLWTVCDEPLEGPGITNFGRLSTDKLAELYRSAWVFCLPSLYEGFGVPYIEALASGTAVVATPNPGAIEVLDGGEYGRIAADPDLGPALITLLCDSTAREELERKGQIRKDAYSWESVVSEYEEIYSTVARSGQRKGKAPG